MGNPVFIYRTPAMMNLIFADPVFEPEKWETIETEDIHSELQSRFPEWPETARIYHGQIAHDRDVTPYNKKGIERLATLEGDVFVVVYPHGWDWVLYAAIAIVAAVAAVMLVPTPAIPNLKNTQATSANNSLGNRTNQARPKSRIPDIQGQVRAVPDAIDLPFDIFENHVQKQVSLLCLGVGEYEIDADEVKDGETPVNAILGSSVAVYGPGDYPGKSGVTPVLEIGEAINEGVYLTYKSNSVNGQTLKPPNYRTYSGNQDVVFRYPNEILLKEVNYFDDFEFDSEEEEGEELFQDGDSITVQVDPFYIVIDGDGVTVTDALRCTPDGEIEFQTNDASAFAASDTVELKNAIFTSPETQQVESGVATILDTNDSVAVVLSEDMPSTAYSVYVEAADGSDVYVTGKTVSGFTISRSGTSGALDVDWEAVSAEGSPGITIDLSGIYTVASVSAGVLALSSPENTNLDWDNIATAFGTGNPTSYKTATVDKFAGTIETDLSETYTISTVSDVTYEGATWKSLALSSPASVNSDWNFLDDAPGDVSPLTNAIISSSENNWVGPFIIQRSELKRLICNFVQPNGGFKDDGKKQISASVSVQVEVTPVDSSGTPTGAAEYFTKSVFGSSTTRDQRAATAFIEPVAGPSAFSVRAKRLTPEDKDFEGTVVDEVKWRDLYGQIEITEPDFGDVTTVQSKTEATQTATGIKERKLNMLVTRKYPTRDGETDSFTSSIFATKRADDIFCARALDPNVGNLTIDELDLDSIYGAIAQVEAYFGDESMVEFCYTFDSSELSLEEELKQIAETVFCRAYRQGRKIRLVPDISSNLSSLLFNHCNKVPDSERRTVRFGLRKDADGVELEYTDETDDAFISLYLPEDQSAVNPITAQATGVRNRRQAYAHAWRSYNELLFQDETSDFTATEEAELLVQTNRVMNTDNTTDINQEGEILSVSGLILETSQEVTVSADSVIWLQHTDATMEAIPISAGADAYHVVLDYAPKQSLAVSDQNYRRTTYVITEGDAIAEAFRVNTIEPGGDGTVSVSLAKYTPLLFQNDGLRLWLRVEDVAGVDVIFDRGMDDLAPAGVNEAIADDGTRGKVLDLTAIGALFNPATGVPATSYSLLAWIKPASDADETILSDGAETYLARTAAGALEASHGVDSVDTGAASLPTGTWSHIAIVFDGTAESGSNNVFVYIDGVLSASGEIATHAPSGDITLAGSALLDEPRFYSRPLAGEEVRAIYTEEDQ